MTLLGKTSITSISITNKIMELDFDRTNKSNASLWENIRKKKERIKEVHQKECRKPGEKGAPTKEQIERAKGEANGATNTKEV